MFYVLFFPKNWSSCNIRREAHPAFHKSFVKQQHKGEQGFQVWSVLLSELGAISS